MRMRAEGKKWIPEDLKEDRIRNYLKRLYGSKAFNPDGTLKVEYINRALKKTKDTSLKRALNLAKTFKKMSKKRKK